MNKSDRSYLIAVIFFSIGFLGFTLLPQAQLYVLWFITLGIGVLLFFMRIITGDD